MNVVSIEIVREVLENYLPLGEADIIEEMVEAILVAELHKKSHTAGVGFE